MESLLILVEIFSPQSVQKKVSWISLKLTLLERAKIEIYEINCTNCSISKTSEL